MTTHPRLELNGPMQTGFEEVLTPDALEFVAELDRRFGPRRRELLEARALRRARLEKVSVSNRDSALAGARTVRGRAHRDPGSTVVLFNVSSEARDPYGHRARQFPDLGWAAKIGIPRSARD